MRPVPGRSTTRLSTLWPIHSRLVPASMEMAPPSVPGMPQANSRPVSDALAAVWTTFESGTAAPAHTVAASLDASTCEKSRPSTMTQPSKPSSATSRFEPLPTTTQSTSWDVRTSMTRWSAEMVWHTASIAAGPPMR